MISKGSIVWFLQPQALASGWEWMVKVWEGYYYPHTILQSPTHYYNPHTTYHNHPHTHTHTLLLYKTTTHDYHPHPTKPNPHTSFVNIRNAKLTESKDNISEVAHSTRSLSFPNVLWFFLQRYFSIFQLVESTPETKKMSYCVRRFSKKTITTKKMRHLPIKLI